MNFSSFSFGFGRNKAREEQSLLIDNDEPTSPTTNSVNLFDNNVAFEDLNNDKGDKKTWDLMDNFEDKDNIYGDFQSTKKQEDDFGELNKNKKQDSFSNFQTKEDDIFGEFNSSNKEVDLFDDFNTSRKERDIIDEFNNNKKQGGIFDDFNSSKKQEVFDNNDGYGDFTSSTNFDSYGDFVTAPTDNLHLSEFLNTTTPDQFFDKEEKSQIMDKKRMSIDLKKKIENNTIDEMDLLDKSYFPDFNIKTPKKDKFLVPPRKQSLNSTLKVRSHLDIDPWFLIIDYILTEYNNSIQLFNLLEQQLSFNERNLLNQYQPISNYLNGLLELKVIVDRIEYSIKYHEIEIELKFNEMEEVYSNIVNLLMRLNLKIPSKSNLLISESKNKDLKMCNVCYLPLEEGYPYLNHSSCINLKNKLKNNNNNIEQANLLI